MKIIDQKEQSAYLQREVDLFFTDSVETYFAQKITAHTVVEYVCFLFQEVESDLKKFKGEKFAIEFKSLLESKIKNYKKGML